MVGDKAPLSIIIRDDEEPGDFFTSEVSHPVTKESVSSIH